MSDRTSGWGGENTPGPQPLPGFVCLTDDGSDRDPVEALAEEFLERFRGGEHGGLHYYVMQLIHGQGLDQVLGELLRIRNTGGCGEAADTVPAGWVAQSLLTGAGLQRTEGDAGPPGDPVSLRCGALPAS